MSGGRQQGILSREEATPQAVMALAVANSVEPTIAAYTEDHPVPAGARQEG